MSYDSYPYRFCDYCGKEGIKEEMVEEDGCIYNKECYEEAIKKGEI